MTAQFPTSPNACLEDTQKIQIWSSFFKLQLIMSGMFLMFFLHFSAYFMCSIFPHRLSPFLHHRNTSYFHVCLIQ